MVCAVTREQVLHDNFLNYYVKQELELYES